MIQANQHYRLESGPLVSGLRSYSCYLGRIWVNIGLDISKYPMLNKLGSRKKTLIISGSREKTLIQIFLKEYVLYSPINLFILLELQSVSCSFKYIIINNQYCTVQSNTNMIPQYALGKHLEEVCSYQHCPQQCCCMEVEPQLLPVDSPLGPPHWTAVGEEKPLPGLLHPIWKQMRLDKETLL